MKNSTGFPSSLLARFATGSSTQLTLMSTIDDIRGQLENIINTMPQLVCHVVLPLNYGCANFCGFTHDSLSELSHLIRFYEPRITLLDIEYDQENHTMTLLAKHNDVEHSDPILLTIEAETSTAMSLYEHLR